MSATKEFLIVIGSLQVSLGFLILVGNGCAMVFDTYTKYTQTERILGTLGVGLGLILAPVAWSILALASSDETK